MEHVLQSINKLNRSIEGVIAVGNEFGAVEALWSQFENVMAKEGPEPEVKEADEEEERRKGDQQTEEDEGGEVDDGRDEDEVG
ncbi:MAG: hypothetical protein LQ351_002657 [Letrouitia transgressa]|nr:MAG: hypothetical protein LQ351_002657 [Letrouitia transgressa]